MSTDRLAAIDALCWDCRRQSQCDTDPLDEACPRHPQAWAVRPMGSRADPLGPASCLAAGRLLLATWLGLGWLAVQAWRAVGW